MFLRITPHHLRYPCGTDLPGVRGLLFPSFTVHVHQWDDRDIRSASGVLDIRGLSRGSPHFDMDADSMGSLVQELPEWGVLLEDAVRMQYGQPRAHPCMAGDRPSVMGILNVTPDSFSDGGMHPDTETALEHAERMMDEGADIIDVGGESTRPFSSSVTAEEELCRVIPVIKGISSSWDVPISVDTMKAEVAEKAIDSGASIVNDINGLRDDSMLDVVASSSVPVVIMHMRGTPRDMQLAVGYNDLVREIVDELRFMTSRALDAGVRAENIIVDPGIGFGKTARDNLEIVNRLREFRCLGFPVLLGASRKSFIGKTLSVDETERLEGSLAVSVLAMQNGAEFIRVHDVRETCRTLKMVRAVETLTL